MDAFECIATKLDIREFDSRSVPADVKVKVLDAARLTASGHNEQHWRFILVQERERLKLLAEDSTSGSWVANAHFAVIVLTNPESGRAGDHFIDAGRVVQDMQLAAWNYGVVSRIYTGIKQENLRKDFSIPNELNPTVVIGFGYPITKILGKKSRRALSELAFLDRYGQRFDAKKL